MCSLLPPPPPPPPPPLPPPAQALICRNHGVPLPKPLDSVVARFLGGPDVNYYWPPAGSAAGGGPSVVSAVRDAFRNPVSRKQ